MSASHVGCTHVSVADWIEIYQKYISYRKYELEYSLGGICAGFCCAWIRAFRVESAGRTLLYWHLRQPAPGRPRAFRRVPHAPLGFGLKRIVPRCSLAPFLSPVKGKKERRRQQRQEPTQNHSDCARARTPEQAAPFSICVLPHYPYSTRRLVAGDWDACMLTLLQDAWRFKWRVSLGD